MSTFPVLKTGAVIQFPATRAQEFATDVIQFIDGTEQRFRNYAQPYRRWLIQLDALDETELQAARNFSNETGTAGLFSFTDPWDSAVYPTCRIDGAGMSDVSNGPARAATSFIVRECRA